MAKRDKEPTLGFLQFARDAGLSPAAVADVCGVTPHEVLQWEKGGPPPRAVALVFAAAAFGVDAIDRSEVARVRAFCEAR